MSGEPVLEIHTSRRIRVLGVLGLIAFVAAVFWSVFVLDAPRAVRMALPDAIARHYLAVELAVGSFSVFALGGLLVGCLLHGDMVGGKAILDQSGVTIDKRFAGRSCVLRVAWGDVTSFDDGSRWYVRIHRRSPERRDFYRLTIPTPTDDTRRGVLEILVRQGIPRVEN